MDKVERDELEWKRVVARVIVESLNSGAVVAIPDRLDWEVLWLNQINSEEKPN